MPPQQHLYNGLPRPTDYYIFHGNVLARLRESPCWHMSGLARTDSGLAYGLSAGLESAC